MALGPNATLSYADVVAAAMKATGATNAGQLADAIGMGGRNEAKRVHNWVVGNNAPDYEGTMLLLDAAGWLNMAADVPQGDRLPADPLERLAVAARDQGEVLGMVLEEIRGLRAEVSAVATSGQARPKRKGAR